jgi:hypothetical protein
MTSDLIAKEDDIATAVAGVTATSLGLGNVTNTSDANKPVSTAQQTALNLKANLASPTFTGTVVLPSATVTLAMQANLAANSFQGNNTGSAAAPIALTVAQSKTLLALVKSDVGLGSVDNTADTAKPVSTAQQTALNLKANSASPTFTGTVTIPTGASITAPSGLVKGDVGLGNVDNTADASKAFAASQITSGTFAIARIPTGTTSTTVPLGGVITAAGPQGDAAHTQVVTFNAAGQLTAVTNTAIAIAASQVTSGLAGTYAPLASPAFTGTVTAAAITSSNIITAVVLAAGGGLAGLDFVGTEYNSYANPCTIDLRSFGGTGGGSEVATPSGTNIAGMHVGAWGTAPIDCAQFFCRSTQLFSGTQSGTAWDFYTTQNGTNSKTLAFTIDQDGSLDIAATGMTNTASRTDANMTSTQTFSTTASMVHTAFNFGGTDTWTVAPAAANMFIGFQNAGTFQNAAANAISLAPIFSFSANYVKQVDTKTGIALGADVDFRCAPIYQVANSGTFASGGHTGFASTLTLNAASSTLGTHFGFTSNALIVAGTLTTLTHFAVANAVNAGTITTQIGLDIAALSSGGTNIGIRNKANTQLGSSGQLTVDTSGNLSTSGGLTTTGSGALSVAGAATHSGTTALNGTVTVADAINIAVGTSTGTQIGTATGQKIGFHGATPVVQDTTAGAAPAGGTGAAAGGWDTAAHRDTAITLINQMRTCLRNHGLMA